MIGKRLYTENLRKMKNGFKVLVIDKDKIFPEIFIGIKDKDTMIFKLNRDRGLNLLCDLDKDNEFYEWFEDDKKVTFQEAVEIRNKNNKVIYVKLNGNVSSVFKFDKNTNELINDYGRAVTTDEILKGEWFVVDSQFYIN